MRQVAAQTLYDNSRYCAPEILAAIARDELRVPQQEHWPKYCSPINYVCRFAWVNLPNTQARLLNANRYLRAFASLQDTGEALPPGYSRDGAHLSFRLHPETEDDSGKAVSLPLPGSRLPEGTY